MFTELKNKTALISGGGSGIGKTISLRLAEAGVNTVLCGRRIEPLEETLLQIKSKGGQGLALQADISKEKDVQRIVEQTIETYNRLDILVNNAGINGQAPVHIQDPQEWDRVMEINLRGPFLLAHAILPIMRRQKEGDILNISSESGLFHYRSSGAYGVSKHALNDLAETIQAENLKYGIRVFTICPSFVNTEMVSDLSLDPQKALQPEDVADLALWMLSRRRGIRIGTPVWLATTQDPLQK